MYKIDLSTGIVTTENGEQVAPCQSANDAKFIAYCNWVEAGNEPTPIVFEPLTTVPDSAESVKLKMVLAQYGIYDDIEQVVSTQDAMTRLMWQLPTWSRGNANLIAMVTQLRNLPEVQAVVGDDVDAFMEEWFSDVQTINLG